MSELKSCPFCGGYAEVIRHETGKGAFALIGYNAHCTNCFASIDYGGRKEAVTAWNRRDDQWISLDGVKLEGVDLG